MRLKPQNRTQWIGLIFVTSFLIFLACTFLITGVAILGPVLTGPVGEGESRLPGLISTGFTFLICIVPTMIPFLLIGGFLVYKLLNPIVARSRVDKPEMILSKETLRVGDSFQATYRQGFKVGADVEKIKIEFVLRETATYRRGTNTYTAVHNHTHYEQTYPGRRYENGQQFEDAIELAIPKDGMHTFMATRNKLQWFIRVEIDFANWPDYKEDFEVKVRPEISA